MLTQITAKTQRGDLVVGNFTGPPTDDPLTIVGEIDGLGAQKADIGTVQYAENDGVSIPAITRGSRNIVLRLGLNPDWATQTMSELRRQVYKYFLTKQYVKLVFTSDLLEEVAIDCFVESCDPDMFSEDPVMTISLIAPNPDFVGTAIVTLSDTFDTDDTTPLTVTYPGDIPSPIIMLIAPGSYIGEFDLGLSWVVPDGMPGVEQTFNFHRYANLGTYVRLITFPTVRELAELDSGGAVIDNLLRTVEDPHDWLKLWPGDNDFTAVTPGHTGITWNLYYYNRYGGL